MKKLICTAAAFAMVAGIVATASAEVKLSGDARARLRYMDKGVGDSVTKWDSRVRVKFAASTEGGAYAKARLRFLDGTWGLGNEYSSSAKGTDNVWSDYAYLGFKKGNLDVAAGKMVLGFSPWFLDDERADRLRIKFAAGGTSVSLTYDKRVYEYKDTFNTYSIPYTTADGTVVEYVVQVAGDTLGGDKDVYGVTFRQQFNDNAKMGVRLAYVDDGTTADRSGLKASINTEVKFGDNQINAEISYKDGDAVTVAETATAAAYAAGDDQMGGYVAWTGSFGAVTPSVVVGMTQDGFTADETFGWLMIGGDVPTSVVSRVGQAGDTMFAGVSAGFQASEDLSFKANLGLVDIDESVSGYGENPIEVSAQAQYDVVKGAYILVRAGWLGSDGCNDDAIAAYTELGVSF